MYVNGHHIQNEFFIDQCQVPYLFFSTSLGTRSYNTQESSSDPNTFNDQVKALLSFDSINKRLYTYTSEERFTSYNLDGSESTTIGIDNVELFTVDGQNNLIYYYHEAQNRIWLYNISSRESSEVAALADYASVKDLEMDVTNG